jgi:RNA polymerase sigma factor (TIGR02999 family)
MSVPGDITSLLAAIKRGDSAAEAELIALVHSDLHALARRCMRQERSDHTLQPTALVNEAYIRFMRRSTTPLDRGHFFATAAMVMRRVLVDHARERHALKRGGVANKIELDDFVASKSPPPDQWLILDEALTKLAALDSRQAQLVELVFFAGLTIEEAAAQTGTSERTAKRDWKAAKAWLKAELERELQMKRSDPYDLDPRGVRTRR